MDRFKVRIIVCNIFLKLFKSLGRVAGIKHMHDGYLGTYLDHNQVELRGRDYGRFSILSKIRMRMGRECYNLRVNMAQKITKEAYGAKPPQLGPRSQLRIFDK